MEDDLGRVLRLEHPEVRQRLNRIVVERATAFRLTPRQIAVAQEAVYAAWVKVGDLAGIRRIEIDAPAWLESDRHQEFGAIVKSKAMEMVDLYRSVVFVERIDRECELAARADDRASPSA